MRRVTKLRAPMLLRNKPGVTLPDIGGGSGATIADSSTLDYDANYVSFRRLVDRKVWLDRGYFRLSWDDAEHSMILAAC